MTARPTAEVERRVAAAGAPRHAHESPLLQGDLSYFSAFDLLQYLVFLRKSGRIQLHAADGVTASCRISAGQLLAAEAGHLTGLEAALSLVWWKSGEFVVLPAATVSGADVGWAIDDLMMNAVRLSDELEHRAEHLPAEDTPLTLSGGDLPPDELGCDLPLIVAAVLAEPGITRQLLERRLPLCRMKVRLALAELARTGRLQGEPSSPSAAASASEKSTELSAELSRRFPRGLHVLVAHGRGSGPDRLAAATAALSNSLGSPSLATSVVPNGPFSVRFRSGSSALLSLTVLAIERKNRFVFGTMMHLVDAVFFVGDAETAEELGAWREMVPAGRDVAVLSAERPLAEELVAQITRRAGIES